MKSTRRNFLHVVAGGLGYVSLLGLFIPSAHAQLKPKPKHPKDVLCGFQPSPGSRPLFSMEIICRDYIAREVLPGDINRQDLIHDQDCSKCNYEDECKASGTRFAFAKRKLTRTFYPALFAKVYNNEFVNPIDLPEMWSRKLQKKWYEKYFSRRV